MAPGVAQQWGEGDVLQRILDAMQASGLTAANASVETLAPLDHFHARGFQATRELADVLPVKAGDHLIDIGCGVGGPARYFAQRFGCRVDGIDITEPFVIAANHLSELTGLSGRVRVRLGTATACPIRIRLSMAGIPSTSP